MNSVTNSVLVADKNVQAALVSPLSKVSQRVLRGVTICHLTPIQTRRDDRAFSREALPMAALGLRPSIVGPHSQHGFLQSVAFIPLARSRNRATRILSASRILIKALQMRADIYHIHCPEMIPPGLALKLFFRKRVVYDTREDFPAMMLTKTYIPTRLRKFARGLVARFERLAARYLDGFVTADSGSLRPHAKCGKSKKLVFYNFPNLQFFPEPALVKKPYDIVYRGGLSERAGTFVLLNSVRLLAEEGFPVRTLMFGYSDNRESEQLIRDYISKLGIQHLITLSGTIPYSEMAATLSQARVAVCPLQKIPKFLNNIPVKVFESWACGLPVIATDLPPIRPFFGNSDLGLLVKPGDPQELAAAIRELLSDHDRMARQGRKARDAVLERYNNGAQVNKLLSFYRAVLGC